MCGEQFPVDRQRIVQRAGFLEAAAEPEHEIAFGSKTCTGLPQAGDSRVVASLSPLGKAKVEERNRMTRRMAESLQGDGPCLLGAALLEQQGRQLAARPSVGGRCAKGRTQPGPGLLHGATRGQQMAQVVGCLRRHIGFGDRPTQLGFRLDRLPGGSKRDTEVDLRLRPGALRDRPAQERRRDRGIALLQREHATHVEPFGVAGVLLQQAVERGERRGGVTALLCRGCLLQQGCTVQRRWSTHGHSRKVRAIVDSRSLNRNRLPPRNPSGSVAAPGHRPAARQSHSRKRRAYRMSSTEELFRSAIEHYRSGRGQQARRICREIVAHDARHGPAQAMLGLLAHREHDHGEAARRFLLASEAQPDQPLHRVNLGVALLAAERWDEAAAAMAQATTAFPHHAELWAILGNAHAGNELWDRAETAFARASEAEPQKPEHVYNQALACDRAGRMEQAERLYRSVLEDDPRHGDARNNLGLLLMAAGRSREASECFAAAFIAGSHAGAGLNLSRCLTAGGEAQRAVEVARHVASAHPEMAQAHHYLGEALEAASDIASATICYRRALELDPGDEAARAALFLSLHATGDLAGADHLEATVVAEALARAGQGKRPRLTPFAAMACALEPEQEALLARATSAELARGVDPDHAFWRHGPAAQGRREGERIRLGYLSDDYRDQATAHLAVGLFENHDRDRFEVVAISHTGPSEDSHRKRIEARVDRFLDITAMNHDEAARAIASAGIDVVVDLKGHTRGNRLAILARRPAPLQITYLGFPGTTGAPWIDVLVADATVAPPGIARHYSERTLHLPGCYQINDNRAPIAQRPATRHEVGLPEAAMVYACFNELWKIDSATFDLWCAILGSVPGSVLWLRDGGDVAQANLQREATARGLDPARLFFAPLLPKDRHLARVRLADLFLDTLRVNAHTTATDALWAGLPLVTTAGPRFPSRVATSLLQAAGLADLACPDAVSYRDLAIALGRDEARRRSLRARMDSVRNSPLFDSAGRTRALEALLVEERLQTTL